MGTAKDDVRLETRLDKLAGCLGRMTVREGARRTVPETRQKKPCCAKDLQGVRAGGGGGLPERSWVQRNRLFIRQGVSRIAWSGVARLVVVVGPSVLFRTEGQRLSFWTYFVGLANQMGSRSRIGRVRLRARRQGQYRSRGTFVRPP